MIVPVMHPRIDERPRKSSRFLPSSCMRVRTQLRPTFDKLGPLLAVLLICCALSFTATPSLAQTSSKEQMQSLDEQVQEIKSEVLSIAAELNQLEEKLLYPSNTQVAVFVSLAEDQSFQVDSVQIQIDGELVAHHIYSFKELDALKNGGVQRIYTGNVPTGEHQNDVSVAGKLPGGDDLLAAQSFAFTKQVEPKLVEIKLSADDAVIQLGGL